MASDQQTALVVFRRLLDGQRGRLSPGDPQVPPHIRVSCDLFITAAEHDAIDRALNLTPKK